MQNQICNTEDETKLIRFVDSELQVTDVAPSDGGYFLQTEPDLKWNSDRCTQAEILDSMLFARQLSGVSQLIIK